MIINNNIFIFARLPDLRIYPKILAIFEGARIFLGSYFFEKNLGINLGNYRNCSVEFFAFVSVVLLIAYCYFFLVRESQNKCLMEPHRAVK